MTYTFLCEKEKNTTHMHRVPHTVTSGAVTCHIGEPLNIDDMFLTPHKWFLLRCTQLIWLTFPSLMPSRASVRVHLEDVLYKNNFSSLNRAAHISPSCQPLTISKALLLKARTSSLFQEKSAGQQAGDAEKTGPPITMNSPQGHINLLYQAWLAASWRFQRS